MNSLGSLVLTASCSVSWRGRVASLLAGALLAGGTAVVLAPPAPPTPTSARPSPPFAGRRPRTGRHRRAGPETGELYETEADRRCSALVVKILRWSCWTG